MKPKFPEIVDRIEKQLLRGDHRLMPIPGSETLARQMGVSYLTARRAIQELVQKGVLYRQPGGRVMVNQDRIAAKVPLQTAFLAPAFASPAVEQLRHAIERTAAEKGISVRPVDYVHWDDPVVRETIENFDGVFLVQSSEKMSLYVKDYLSKTSKPVVLADIELADINLPYFDFLPAESLDKLMQHLVSLGHKKFLCLNSHPKTAVVLTRIARWRQFMQNHNLTGDLLDEPVQPYSHPTSQAHHILCAAIAKQKYRFDATAIVCVSLAAAVGTIRALEDNGIHVGKDVAVCAIDGESLARYHYPSITCMEKADMSTAISQCFEWFASGDKWRGEKRLSSQPELFIGESTKGYGKVIQNAKNCEKTSISQRMY